MQPKEMAKLLATVLEEKKGRDLRVLEVTELTILADYFLVCTATSNTHARTLADECAFLLKQRGELPHHIEQDAGQQWILLDFGAVVVHVFLEEQRKFYGLERLWADAKSWESVKEDFE
jgi:ribosome-associated protein